MERITFLLCKKTQQYWWASVPFHSSISMMWKSPLLLLINKQAEHGERATAFCFLHFRDTQFFNWALTSATGARTEIEIPHVESAKQFELGVKFSVCVRPERADYENRVLGPLDKSNVLFAVGHCIPPQHLRSTAAESQHDRYENVIFNHTVMAQWKKRKLKLLISLWGWHSV